MKTRPKPPPALAMDLLIREILFTYFRLNAIGERLFESIGQTPGKVSLMRSLVEQGPQSVVQIARARPVARQAVQRMADELAEQELIEFVENPTHRRAKLAQLTVKGRKIVEQAMAAELRWARQLACSFGDAEIAIALDVIQRVRRTLGDFIVSPPSSNRRGRSGRKRHRV
jgi:DNA-binding MarR family transcriptional regulator